MPENIEVSDNPEASRFEILVDGEVAGFAQYRRRPNKIFFAYRDLSQVRGNGPGQPPGRRGPGPEPCIEPAGRTALSFRRSIYTAAPRIRDLVHEATSISSKTAKARRVGTAAPGGRSAPPPFLSPSTSVDDQARSRALGRPQRPSGVSTSVLSTIPRHAHSGVTELKSVSAASRSSGSSTRRRCPRTRR